MIPIGYKHVFFYYFKVVETVTKLYKMSQYILRKFTAKKNSLYKAKKLLCKLL